MKYFSQLFCSLFCLFFFISFYKKVVKLEKVDMKNKILYISGVDLVHGTPVVDIKPYVPHYDSIPTAKIPDWVKTSLTVSIVSIFILFSSLSCFLVSLSLFLFLSFSFSVSLSFSLHVCMFPRTKLKKKLTLTTRLNPSFTLFFFSFSSLSSSSC